MSQQQPGYEYFPAVGVEDLEPHIHETTGDEYIYYAEKHSWRVLNAAKNKIFTGPNSPDTPLLSGNVAGYVPTAGDLWWDTEHMELRVWNQPDPEDPLDQVPTPGRWISSTNPHMSALSPNKNLVIGKLTIVDGASETLTNGIIYEGFDYDYEVTRTDSNAPESSVAYEWKANPSEIDGNPVIITHPTAMKTRITVPDLRRDNNGNPIQESIRITCYVRATKDVEKFLEPQKNISTGIMAIRPVPAAAEPITGNVTVEYKTGGEIFGNGGIDPIYKVYEFDTEGKIQFDTYDNTSNGFPPGSLTYGVWSVLEAYSNETTEIKFKFVEEADFNSNPLCFWEDQERTIKWGRTADTGADLGVDPPERTHSILVDENFRGNVYFSKKPVGADPGMAGHIIWGFTPDPTGDIGTVSITGDLEPGKNIVTPYTVTYSGNLPPDTEDLSITLSTTDPDATIDQDLLNVKFSTVGSHQITATVRSIYASDSPRMATIQVMVGDGLDSIGNVTIEGSDTTVVGIPEVYNTFIDGDVQNYNIVYTTTDTSATVTANSIIFGSVGNFDVSTVVTAEDVIEPGPVTATMSVDVKSGVTSVITTDRDPAFTDRQQSFLIKPSIDIEDATYTWKTTRSDGGTVWEAKPDECVTGGTSGRETGEELVDGDVDGDSFVRLNSTSQGASGGLFITYPKSVNPVKIGLIVSCLDINGNNSDEESVNVTIQSLNVDSTPGNSYTTTIKTSTPYETVLDLSLVDQEIYGMRVQTTTSGHKLAVHGYTINDAVITSFINDDIVNSGATAAITMYRFDEERVVQCTVDGTAGRTVGRLALDVINPPTPTIGVTRFQIPPKQVVPNTDYVYKFTNNATIPVAYTATFMVTEGDLVGAEQEVIDKMVDFDLSDITNNNIGMKINFMIDNDSYHSSTFGGTLRLIIDDARDENDIFEDEGGKLDPQFADVSNIKVNSGVFFTTTSSVPSDESPAADTDFYQGYGIGATNIDPFGVIIMGSRTSSGLTAVDENGNPFDPVSVEADAPDTYSAIFNLPAGTYVFESTVTYNFAGEPDTNYSSVYKHVRTVV